MTAPISIPRDEWSHEMACLLDPTCEVCDQRVTGDIHYPHHSICGGTDDPMCTCDRITCATCCPSCDQFPAPTAIGADAAAGETGSPSSSSAQDSAAPAAAHISTAHDNRVHSYSSPRVMGTGTDRSPGLGRSTFADKETP